MTQTTIDPLAGEYTPLRNVQKPLPRITATWEADQVARVQQTLDSKPGTPECKQKLTTAFGDWLGQNERIINDYLSLPEREARCAQAQQELAIKLQRYPGLIQPESPDQLTPDEIETIIDDVVQARTHKLKLSAGISKAFLSGKLLLETSLALPFVHNAMSALELEWNAVTGIIAFIFAATLGIVPQLLFRKWYQLFKGITTISDPRKQKARTQKAPAGDVTTHIDDHFNQQPDNEMHVAGQVFLLVLFSVGLATTGYTWWFVDSYTFSTRLSPEIAPGMALVTTIVLFLTGFLLAIKDETTSCEMNGTDGYEASFRKLIEKEYAVTRQTYLPQDQEDLVKSRFAWLLDNCKEHQADIEALNLGDAAAVTNMMTALRKES